VVFWSRKFSGTELGYGTPDHELFAIVESFKHWRHYLDGSRYAVEVLSDHSNLQAFMRQVKLNGRQARWCMYLAPFDFVIKHRSGITNPADAPSRRPDYEGDAGPQTELLTPLQQKLGTVEVLNARDLAWPLSPANPEGLPPVVADAEKLFWERSLPRALVASACIQERPQCPVAASDLLALIERLQNEDPETQALKAKITRADDGSAPQRWSVDQEGLVRYDGCLLIPGSEGLRQELLRLYHDSPLAGHFGVGRTIELLRRKFFWKNITADVKQYVKECAVCQGNVAKRHPPYGKLESLPLPVGPFQELSMDFITGLPAVRWKGEERDAILVVVDRYTKMSLFFPVSTTMTSAKACGTIPPRGRASLRRTEGYCLRQGTSFHWPILTRAVLSQPD